MRRKPGTSSAKGARSAARDARREREAKRTGSRRRDADAPSAADTDIVVDLAAPDAAGDAPGGVLPPTRNSPPSDTADDTGVGNSDASADRLSVVASGADDDLRRVEPVDAVIADASADVALLTAPVEGIIPNDASGESPGDAPDHDAADAAHDVSVDPADAGVTADGALDQTRAGAQRLSDPSSAAARFARSLHEICSEADRDLSSAVDARQEQQLAWLVLCDRGWPSDRKLDEHVLPTAHGWLAVWNEFCAMPVKADGIIVRFRLRGIQKRLEKAEVALRPFLPSELWRLVSPLDATGRSTLAYALQAVTGLEAANTQFAAALSRKDVLSARFAALGVQARELGLTPPAAALDVEAWRSLAELACNAR